MTEEEREQQNSIKMRGVHFYELFNFFKFAINAETPNLRYKPIVLFGVFLLMLINIFFLTIPQRLLLRIVDMAFVELDGQTVGGFLVVDKLKSRGYYHFGAFFIRPVYQGKGYGNQVMAIIVEGYGHSKITLGVDGNNERAINLYKKYGFKISESVQKYQIPLPLGKQDFEPPPEDYVIESLNEDFLDELVNSSDKIHTLPNINEFYKDFEEYQKNKRFTNKQVLLIRYKRQIIGLGRINWKTLRNKAKFEGTILKEHIEAFSYLFRHCADLTANQGASILEWIRTRQNEFLFQSMESFLNSPGKYELSMERDPL